MPQTAPDKDRERDSRIGYAGNLDHLTDEMRRLDILIQIMVHLRRKPASPLDQFKGLVLSEEEIDDLLANAALPADEVNYRDGKTAPHEMVRRLEALELEIQERRSASLGNGVYLSLPYISGLFSLNCFEERCILACLAPELNRKYEKLYAYLQDDVTCKKPSIDLLLDLNCDTVEQKLSGRLAFSHEAPLMKYRLLQVSEGAQDLTLIARQVKLDDRIASLLLGGEQVDARLMSSARLILPDQTAERVRVNNDITEKATTFVRSYFDSPNTAGHGLILYFHGPFGSGTGLLAKNICRDLQLPLILADVEKVLSGPVPFQEATLLLGRESALQSAALCLENFDSLLTDDDKYLSELKTLIAMMQTFSRLTFLLGKRSWRPFELLSRQAFMDVELPVPDETERKRLWEDHSSFYQSIETGGDFGALASKFQLTSGQIQSALIHAQALALWRAPEDAQITPADLHAAARAQSNLKIGKLARKLEPKYVWADIVLPPDLMAQLSEICNQARFRHVVYGEWGFNRKLSSGKGLNVLFSGPPGTGKTMAAEVIATELQLDLYKIDLSQVVSKYVGETEKNLHHIFREARASGAILFFDEADALFGKRSEVKDAHDRYANIEIGYLLQEMEEYDGIAILATNLRQNLDEAFVRRMQFITEFPFPDEEYRQRIWEVTFPRETPLAGDVDFSVLSREIRLAGGNIKNIALASAFYAASDGGAVRMAHILHAARREFQKLGRTWDEPS